MINPEMSDARMKRIVTRMAERCWVWVKGNEIIAYVTDPNGPGQAIYAVYNAEFPEGSTEETINEVTNSVTSLITMVLNLITQNPSHIQDGSEQDAEDTLTNMRINAPLHGYRLVKTDKQNG